MLEAVARVQRLAVRVALGDHRDDVAQAVLARNLDQPSEDRLADATTTPVLVDVDGVLSGEAVRRARPIRGQASPPDGLPTHLRSEHAVRTLLALPEPDQAVLQRPRLRVEG